MQKMSDKNETIQIYTKTLVSTFQQGVIKNISWFFFTLNTVVCYQY